MVKKKNISEEHKKNAHEENVPVSENVEETTATSPEENVKAEKEIEKSAVEEELTAKLAEMQDKYLRLSAEFDNYRRRTLREKMEITKTAGESVITSILPVVDDFDRALLSMESSNDCESIKAGIDLIYNKLNGFLKQNGVKEIESLNIDFNSDIHDAVTKVPAPDESSKGKVLDVIQKGYTLNEKIIRHPKVIVGE